MSSLGINSNCECGKDYKETLKNIKQAGFGEVMIASKIGGFEESIVEARRLGLKIPFVHLNTRLSNALWTKGEESEEYINQIIKELGICSIYSIPVAVMHPEEGRPDLKLTTSMEQGVKNMKIILQIAKNLKVKIALENLADDDIDRLEYLLNNIHSPNLGFCYDAGHHNLYNPKFDLLKKYGDRLLAVHLHDNLMDYGKDMDYTRDLHRLPFDGLVDFEKVCENLAKANYKNTIMLEVHKDSCGKPRLYDGLTAMEFLKEAYSRAVKLEKMYKEKSKQIKKASK